MRTMKMSNTLQLLSRNIRIFTYMINSEWENYMILWICCLSLSFEYRTTFVYVATACMSMCSVFTYPDLYIHMCMSTFMVLLLCVYALKINTYTHIWVPYSFNLACCRILELHIRYTWQTNSCTWAYVYRIRYVCVANVQFELVFFLFNRKLNSVRCKKSKMKILIFGRIFFEKNRIVSSFYRIFRVKYRFEFLAGFASKKQDNPAEYRINGSLNLKL